MVIKIKSTSRAWHYLIKHQINRERFFRNRLKQRRF